MLMPRATSGAQAGHEDDQRGCQEAAARLRREHQGWIIIWLTAESQFRAYGRLPGSRRDTTLSAATSINLAAQISQAEQAARRPARARRDGQGKGHDHS
jgi:hypothetical protein